MIKKKKGRKPLIKADDLLAAGYTYKLDVLTDEERDEWLNGAKAIVNGKEERALSRDFDYFFKIMENDVEVQVFHVIRKFYYRGARLKYADQLPTIEKHAAEQKHWDDKLASIKDDKPTEYVLPDTIPKGASLISLVGGPLDGKQRAYITALKFFMEVIGREVVAGKIITRSARYMQTEDKTVYSFKEYV